MTQTHQWDWLPQFCSQSMRPRKINVERRNANQSLKVGLAGAIASVDEYRSPLVAWAPFYLIII